MQLCRKQVKALEEGAAIVISSRLKNDKLIQLDQQITLILQHGKISSSWPVFDWESRESTGKEIYQK